MDKQFENLKLVRRNTLNESNFKEIDSTAKVVISNAKPDDLLVLTITNNSPTLSIKKAEPFTPEAFDRILKD